MSQSLGAGDTRKARAFLGGRGGEAEGDDGSVGAAGGVGGFYSAGTIESFARVVSSVASGGGVLGESDRPSGGGVIP